MQQKYWQCLTFQAKLLKILDYAVKLRGSPAKISCFRVFKGLDRIALNTDFARENIR